ncbi:MAG: hypothetical protein EHM33_05990 [Chloroflexi bacterium]|nr:MAG: hypothetical protein EHM33_05990 [Chloroflexota bacterium]
MKTKLLAISFLLASLLVPRAQTKYAQIEPTICMDVPGGSVCYQEHTPTQGTLTATDTATSTETPTATNTDANTATPTGTPTYTATNTPTSTPTLSADIIYIDLYQNSYSPIVGSVSGGDWAFPGVALTANTKSFLGNFLQGRQLIYARWVLAWNPNTTTSPTGVRLVYFDDGPTNIVEFARNEEASRISPMVGGAFVTSTFQYLVNNGLYKHVGQQTYGNGSNGALIYSSIIELAYR